MATRSRRAPISRGLIPQVGPRRAARPADPGFNVRQTNIQRFGSSRVDTRAVSNIVGGYVRQQEQKGVQDAETFLLENPEVYTRALDFAQKNPGTDAIQRFLQSGELKAEDAPTNARYLQRALAKRAFREYVSDAQGRLSEFNFGENPQADPDEAAAQILADSFEANLEAPVFEDFLGSRDFGQMRAAFDSEFAVKASAEIRRQRVEFNKAEFRQETAGRIQTSQREISQGRRDLGAAQADLGELYQQSRSLFNDSREEFWKAVEGALLSPENDTTDELEDALRYAHGALASMETSPGLTLADDLSDAGRGRTNQQEFSYLVDRLEDRKDRLYQDEARSRGLRFDDVKNDAANLLFPAIAEIDQGPGSERTAAILELQRRTIADYQGPDDLRGQFTEYVQQVSAAALRREAVGSDAIKFQGLNILNREGVAAAQGFLETNLENLSGPDLFALQSAVNEAKEFSKLLHRHDSISALDGLITASTGARSGLPEEDAARIQLEAVDLKGQLLEEMRQRLVNGNPNDEAFLQEFNRDMRAASQDISQKVSQAAAQAKSQVLVERQKALDFHGGNLPTAPGFIDSLNLPPEERQQLKAQNARIRDAFEQAKNRTFDRQVLPLLEDGLNSFSGQLRIRREAQLRARFGAIVGQGTEATASARLQGASERALPILMQELTGVSADVDSEAEAQAAQERVLERDTFISGDPEQADFTQGASYQEAVAATDALSASLRPLSFASPFPTGDSDKVRDQAAIRRGLEGDRDIAALTRAYDAMGRTDEAKQALVSYLSVSGFKLKELEEGVVKLRGRGSILQDIEDGNQLFLTPDLFLHPEMVHLDAPLARIQELSEDEPRLKRLLDTIGHPSDPENAAKFIDAQVRWSEIRKTRK